MMTDFDDEYMLEMNEFSGFPHELLLACMLHAGVGADEIEAYIEKLPGKMTLYFTHSKVFAGAAPTATPEELNEVALELFAAEYPELSSYLLSVFARKDVSDDDDDDEPDPAF